MCKYESMCLLNFPGTKMVICQVQKQLVQNTEREKYTWLWYCKCMPLYVCISRQCGEKKKTLCFQLSI
jgi:hypothetical protein